MKTKFLTLVFKFICMFINAQETYNFGFANKIGNGGSITNLRSVLDLNQNVYSIGTFSGVVDFDPSANVYNLNSTNGGIYLNKINSVGTYVWTKQFNYTGILAVSNNNNFGLPVSSQIDLANDGLGNILILINFWTGLIDCDPSVASFNVYSLALASSQNISLTYVVIKLDSQGNFIWAKQSNNATVYSSFVNAPFGWNSSISVNSNNEVLVASNYKGTISFNPPTSPLNLSSVSVRPFLWKLNTLGNTVWVKEILGNANNDLFSMCVDVNDNIILHGLIDGTADFDPNVGVHNLSGVNKTYIVKWTDAGNFVWAIISGHSLDLSSILPIRTSYIATDANGNIYCAGDLVGASDFDPGASNSNLISFGLQDIVVLKLNPSGGFVWANQIGGVLTDRVCAMEVAYNKVYLCNSFTGTCDFDPSSVCTRNLVAVSNNADLGLVKLDGITGSYLWSGLISGTSNGRFVTDISVNGNDMFLSGSFRGTVDFNPNSGVNNLVSVNTTNYDVFNSKLTLCISGCAISQNPCTSLTKNALNSNEEMLEETNGTTVYPNPNKGIFNLHFGKEYNHVIVQCINISGKAIAEYNLSNVSKSVLELECISGFYWIEVTIDGVKRDRLKMIVE